MKQTSTFLRRVSRCHPSSAGLFCIVLNVSVWAVASNGESEVLDAEKAFSVTARLVGAKTLELRYAIADGYYMYRDRFHFTIDGQPIRVAQKNWPTGRWKHDANFGRVVTYRNSVRLLLPVSLTKLEADPNGRATLTMTAVSQGCADVGICYPPMRQTLRLVPGSFGWVAPNNHIPLSLNSPDTKPGNGLAGSLTGDQ